MLFRIRLGHEYFKLSGYLFTYIEHTIIHYKVLQNQNIVSVALSSKQSKIFLEYTHNHSTKRQVVLSSLQKLLI